MIKLKLRLAYRGHVYFEPVSPEVVRSALQYLKSKNRLYHDILIHVSQIPENLLSLTEPVDIPIEVEIENDFSDNSNNVGDSDNPLQKMID